MIKQKAPKDMTAVEFVEHAQKRLHERAELKEVDRNGELIDFHYFVSILKGILSEPAPNPFTPDQLAWMRIKQGEGYQYAAMDFDNEVRLFGEKPDNDGTHWNGQSGYTEQSIGLWSWMRDYLSTDDPEPLRFADYAPLEEK